MHLCWSETYLYYARLTAMTPSKNYIASYLPFPLLPRTVHHGLVHPLHIDSNAFVEVGAYQEHTSP
jgi:hypothetical protein